MQLQAQPSHVPLGARGLVPAFEAHSPASVVRFLFQLDRLLESVAESEQPLLSDQLPHTLDLTLEEAFFYAPGRLCVRTKVSGVRRSTTSP